MKYYWMEFNRLKDTQQEVRRRYKYMFNKLTHSCIYQLQDNDQQQYEWNKYEIQIIWMLSCVNNYI